LTQDFVGLLYHCRLALCAKKKSAQESQRTNQHDNQLEQDHGCKIMTLTELTGDRILILETREDRIFPPAHRAKARRAAMPCSPS